MTRAIEIKILQFELMKRLHVAEEREDELLQKYGCDIPAGPLRELSSINQKRNDIYFHLNIIKCLE